MGQDVAAALATDDSATGPGGRLDRLLASPLTGFAPWVVLYVLGGTGHVRLACAIALGMSLATLALAKARGTQLKLLSFADVAGFSGFLVGSFIAAPSTVSWFEDWFSECGYLFMVVVIGGSLVARRPITLDYAKEHVDSEYWDTPEFLRVNDIITAVWALAFLGGAGAGLMTDLVLQYDDNIWTNWLLQILAVMTAVAFTTWYAQKTMAASLQRDGRPTDPPPPVWDFWRVAASYLVPVGLASLVFDGGPIALGVGLVAAGAILQDLCRRRADTIRAAQATAPSVLSTATAPT